MSSNEYSDDKPLIAGSLRGYRFWLASQSGLHALHSPYIWRSKLNNASCNKLVCPPETSHNFSSSCTCGFYARYSPDDLMDLTWASVKGPSMVVGVIEGTGTIARGTRGFRAEKAEILAIARFPMYPDQQDSASLSLTEIADRYQLPLYNNFAALCRNFPPDEDLLAWATKQQEFEETKKRQEQNVQIYLSTMAESIKASNFHLDFGSPSPSTINATATRGWFQYQLLNVNSSNIIKNYGA